LISVYQYLEIKPPAFLVEIMEILCVFFYVNIEGWMSQLTDYV